MNQIISPKENRNTVNVSHATTGGLGALNLNTDAQVIARPEDLILVTGANGFIGSWVVRTLLARGFRNIRCLARFEGCTRNLDCIRAEYGASSLRFIYGNLLSPETCKSAAEGAVVVYHLAAGIEKTFSGCFLNSAVTTRNLLNAVMAGTAIKRFVNTSSLAVYSNAKLRRGGVLDETCPIDAHLVERYDPYAYGKAQQDEVVRDYGRSYGLPYVIVRPGLTIGPGKAKIPGRVGIDTFGIFLHLGLGNRMPFTYVENCAEAIVLAGLTRGIEGQEINIIDDNVPRSHTFLRLYKRKVRRIRTIPVPYSIFYFFNYVWEKYSTWSQGQLPPAFNRRACEAYYKSQEFSNAKAKALLGWQPRVSMKEAIERFCTYAREQRVKG